MRRLITSSVFFCVLLLMSAGALVAQDRTITGTVTDAVTEEPIPGANVVVEGTQRGSTTDGDGEYSIQASSDDVLVASFVGYERQAEEVGDRDVVNFELIEDIAQLEDLVVVGYGEQRQQDVTGSVRQVGEAQFNRGRVSSPDQLIAGKIAGLQITQGSGEPGAGSFIRLRGATSINASNDPLFVVDGVPINHVSDTGRNPLNFINPQDVEEISVLRDASATAIYGSRGANGVIQITTKSGRGMEASRITYDGSVSTDSDVQRVDLLNADEYRDLIAEHAPERMDRLGDANTNWQDEILQTSVSHSHDLSIAGGTDDVGYRASLEYLNEEGIVIGSRNERVGFSVNYNHWLLDDALNINANVRGSRTMDDFSPGGAVGAAVEFAPTQPVLDPGNEWGGYWEWDDDLGTKNPIAEIELGQYEAVTNRSLGNIQAEYRLPFFQPLSARINMGYDISAGETRGFQPSFLRNQATEGGELWRNNFQRTSTLFDTYLNYRDTFSEIDSRVDFTAGYSYQDWTNEFPQFRAWDLDSDVLGFHSATVANEREVSTYTAENLLISGFARLNYTFMERYMLTATIRQDGSSRFGPANQWGTFPSAALAWRISEEPFMQGVEALSDLRLRGSWGVTGNQEIGDYNFMRTFVYSDDRAQVRFGDEFVSTIRPSGVDPDLKWEETTSYNIGLDMGFFDDRITGSLEWYYSDTDDLLFETAVPAGANLSNFILTNVGSVRNTGFELELDAMVFQTEEFMWNASFNAATNDNQITNLADQDDPDFVGFLTGGISGGVGNQIQILQEGQPINSFFVRHEEDAEREAYRSPDPTWIMGHTSQFQYNNFDLNFTLRAHLGNHVYNNVASRLGNLNQLTEIVPQNVHRSVFDTGFQAPRFFDSRYVEDGSFLRMDNITLGYAIPDLPHVGSARVYATMQNAFLLTGFEGPDPEFGSGIAGSVYPRSRTFLFGVNLEF